MQRSLQNLMNKLLKTGVAMMLALTAINYQSVMAEGAEPKQPGEGNTEMREGQNNDQESEAGNTPATADPVNSPTPTPEVAPTATPEVMPTSTPEATPATTPTSTPEATPEVKMCIRDSSIESPSRTSFPSSLPTSAAGFFGALRSRQTGLKSQNKHAPSTGSSSIRPALSCWTNSW